MEMITLEVLRKKGLDGRKSYREERAPVSKTPQRQGGVNSEEETGKANDELRS